VPGTSGGFPLPAGFGALSLGRHGEALTFAGILAGAAGVSRRARALALAGIGTDAMAFVCGFSLGMGPGESSVRQANEQGSGGGSQRGTSFQVLLSHIHSWSGWIEIPARIGGDPSMDLCNTQGFHLAGNLALLLCEMGAASIRLVRMMSLLRIFFAAALLSLGACSGGGGDYELRFPALKVAINDSVVLTAAEERPLPVKIFYPESGDSYPLIVLSHGTFSNRNRYDRVAGFWAGQGYVVMVPQHMDADYGVTPSSYEVMQDVIRTRVDDMSQVLDELPVITAAVPDLAAKISSGQYVAAGHSIGTQVAMLVTGARFRTEFNGALMESSEDRYKALILVSDPGKMRLMPRDTWVASSVTTFMATGTDDFGTMGARGAPTEGQTEILRAETDAGVVRYELLLDKGDHYFGGLVQKDRDTEPDDEGLAIFNETSTAFLDAVMKGNARARTYLNSVDMQVATQGRATLARLEVDN
jgi:pimeloyl-ACP methyl ester carboxylesterase